VAPHRSDGFLQRQADRAGDGHGRTKRIEGRFGFPESGWVSAQCSGPNNRFVMGGGLFAGAGQSAETSPVWIEVEGRPQPPSADAELLVKWTDDFREEVERRGKFANDAQRAQMRQVYGRARRIFADMAQRWKDSLSTATAQGGARATVARSRR
jgi:hypothetical protein